MFSFSSFKMWFVTIQNKIINPYSLPHKFYFNKIGENVEQVKTRLGAFMEMFK